MLAGPRREGQRYVDQIKRPTIYLKTKWQKAFSIILYREKVINLNFITRWRGRPEHGDWTYSTCNTSHSTCNTRVGGPKNAPPWGFNHRNRGSEIGVHFFSDRPVYIKRNSLYYKRTENIKEIALISFCRHEVVTHTHTDTHWIQKVLGVPKTSLWVIGKYYNLRNGLLLIVLDWIYTLPWVRSISFTLGSHLALTHTNEYFPYFGLFWLWVYQLVKL